MRIGFKIFFNSDDEKYGKILQSTNALFGNRLRKLKLTIIIKNKNLIQLLVCVMFYCLQTFSVDFLEICEFEEIYEQIHKEKES